MEPLITRLTARSIRRYGLEACRDSWEARASKKPRPQGLTTNQIQMAADAFQELINLDVAGALLEKPPADRPYAVNALRPCTFPVQAEPEEHETINSQV